MGLKLSNIQGNEEEVIKKISRMKSKGKNILREYLENKDYQNVFKFVLTNSHFLQIFDYTKEEIISFKENINNYGIEPFIEKLMSNIILTTNIDKIIKIDNEISSNLESIERFKKKLYGRFLNKKKFHQKDPDVQRNINRLYKRNETLESKKESLKYHHPELRKIFKNLGLKATKASSTAIRGYNRFSSGYDLTSYDKSNIRFNGISIEQFNEIIQAVENQNFIISEIRPPEKVIGGSSISSFKISE